MYFLLQIYLMTKLVQIYKTTIFINNNFLNNIVVINYDKLNGVNDMMNIKTLLNNFNSDEKGQSAIIGIVISLVMIVLGIVIVTTVVNDNSDQITGITATILGFLGAFMALGGLVMAGSIAYGSLKR